MKHKLLYKNKYLMTTLIWSYVFRWNNDAHAFFCDGDDVWNV